MPGPWLAVLYVNRCATVVGGWSSVYSLVCKGWFPPPEAGVVSSGLGRCADNGTQLSLDRNGVLVAFQNQFVPTPPEPWVLLCCVVGDCVEAGGKREYVLWYLRTGACWRDVTSWFLTDYMDRTCRMRDRSGAGGLSGAYLLWSQ